MVNNGNHRFRLLIYTTRVLRISNTKPVIKFIIILITPVYMCANENPNRKP